MTQEEFDRTSEETRLVAALKDNFLAKYFPKVWRDQELAAMIKEERYDNRSPT